MTIFIREKILDGLYKHCKVRNRTSKEVYTNLLLDLQIVPLSGVEDQVLPIIREYKLTGKNLENTVDDLYNLLYPLNEMTGSFYDWNTDGS